MKKYFYAFMFLALSMCMLACTALENYRFGDVTRTALQTANAVVQLKTEYCSDLNAAGREIILSSIRLVDPDYDGVCINGREQKSNVDKDEGDGLKRDPDSVGFLHTIDQRNIIANGEWMRIGISEVRLCAGYDLWLTDNSSMLHPRRGVYLGENLERENSRGQQIFTEYVVNDQQYIWYF